MRLGSTTMTARAHPPMPVGFWALAGELVHYRVRCAAMPASCAGLLAEAKVTLRAVLRHGTRHGHHQGAIFKMECGMGGDHRLRSRRGPPDHGSQCVFSKHI